MRKDYITIGKNEETGLFYGYMFRYKPTPSGCDRWILQCSTVIGFATEREAADVMERAFPELDPIEINA